MNNRHIHIIHRGRSAAVGVWALVCLLAGALSAAPHDGDVFSLRQPDGSRVNVKVYGDEFYQRVESMDGYTLVRDRETGWICYAELSEDGDEFRSTGVIYHGDRAEKERTSREAERISVLSKGLRLRREAILGRAEARRLELTEGGGAETGVRMMALDMPAAAAQESIVGLTILIDFPDLRGTIGQAEIESFCNEVGYSGYGNNGSVRDYFYDVSNGNLEYTNHVTEYYTARQDKSYYDDCSNGRTTELLEEALDWLDGQGFDFSVLSLDSQNRIVALNVFYAGSPDCGWSNGLWPHKGTYTGFTSSSGARSRNYQITSIGSRLRLGTFCHENGHMICSWPDLYDYGGESRGVGGYCIMASSGGTNPMQPNPYFRALKGWETLVEISDDEPGTLRTHQVNSFTTYRYSHPSILSEFFLVESRIKEGRSENIPDEGLLIWHIDEEGSNNREHMTPSRHYRVSVEQADGLFHLERDINGGGSGDLFHKSHNDTFDDYTLPDARWWSGVESGMRITDISDVGSEMTFIVDNISIEVLVSPGAVQEMGGLVCGPFAVSEVVYSMTNFSDASVEWTASKTAGWLSIPSGGVIPVGGAATIEARLTAEAQSLPAGEYSDTIVLTDVGSGVVWEREVRLVLQARELISHWKFDETSGVEVEDSTGHGHSGVLEGGSVFDISSEVGRFGRSVGLDGEDDTVYFESSSLPRPYFSISMWFKPNEDMSRTSSRVDFLYWDDGDHPHITFDRKNTGEIGLYVEFATVEYEDIVTSTRSWAAASWHQVAFTFDGTDFKVYVNGALEAVYRHPGIHVETSNPYLGSRKGNNNFFAGQIDDVRFYNYALSEEGMAAVYMGGRAENPEPEDRAKNVRPYSALSWLAGSDAVGHDVYVGGSYEAVFGATMDSAEYKGRTGESYFSGTVLLEETQYFWRVDEVTAAGETVPGAVWSFTTGTDEDQYDAVYEAEDGVLSAAKTGSGYPGYTGSGYVDYANTSGGFVEWTVFAHYTGTHKIAVRYALSSGDAELEVSVNGRVAYPVLDLPGTGDWSEWAYTGEVSVPLNLGLNTIRATAGGSNGANVDHLRLIDEFDYSNRPAGVQVYLAMDESEGGTAVDSSGNGHDGRLFGDPVWRPGGGVFGGALEFDGVGDYVEVKDFHGIGGTGARTVGAWIKTDDPGPRDIVAWGSSAAGRRWSLRTEESTGAFGVYVSGGSVFGETDVADGEWHHVAAVLDEGRVDVCDVRLYVDGAAEALGSVAAQQIATAESWDVLIGTCGDIRRLYFVGAVDEVAIFDAALTDEQVARLARVGTRSFLVPCGRVIEDEHYAFGADINKDCVVNALDFVLMAEGWLDGGLALFGDVQDDEVIDLRDVSAMSESWLAETTWLAAPLAASEPAPGDGEGKVSLRPELSWKAGEGATSHDVYFGETYPPAFAGNRTEATFQPGLLKYGGKYYWRVDEIGPYGKTVGVVWGFATMSTGRGE